MNRLIVATGTWQIVLAASALHQEKLDEGLVGRDYLVLSAPKLSNEMKQTMMQIASSIWNWQKIIWADDILNSSMTISLANLASFLRGFKERISVANLAELWLCKLTDKAEKIIAEAYPNSAIAIYEDGLHSYVPQEDWQLLDFNLLFKPKRFKYKLNHRIAEVKNDFNCLNKISLCHKHIKRIKKAYFLLADYLPLPKYLQPYYKAISKQSVINALDTINLSINIFDSRDFDQRGFLILGQCFSKWNLISWEEEFNIYSQIFSVVADLNLVPIWKEHPRENRPFFPRLAQNSAIAPVELSVHSAWPIELFAKQLNLQGCVSVTSTSLFNLKSLYEIPTYTIANELLNLFDGDFAYMTNLVANHIPPLSSINSLNTDNTISIV